ncbi:MAG: CocE/NonD family hydrolase, partial [Acidimicrobiia bacterium]|nr:CocE/NonD family hydrolase [Acidimicrobiia bacterium]
GDVVRSDGTRTPVQVLDGSEAVPEDVYDQALGEGYGYVQTRDGTTLAIYVTLPGPRDAGPYPTLVEYSGYDEADPTGSQIGRTIAPPLGYAIVQVNVRGTGCSGGSYDAFEPAQAFDGHDVIETVARQAWALPTVGMLGVSYAGIMQFPVAATRPAHLAAIAPLSVPARLDAVTHPGGIVNDGFATTWTEQVLDAAAAYGQGWEQARVDAGDTTCERNQLLRGHNPDLLAQTRDLASSADRLVERSPAAWAPDITVPTFLAGAWQDEQTGPDVGDLVPLLARADLVRATLYNGGHVDALSPTILGRLKEFYDLTVARTVPSLTPAQRALAPLLAQQVFGVSANLEADRFTAAANWEEAMAAYRAEPTVRVLLEVGGDPALPGVPVPRSELGLTAWPPPDATPRRLRLDAPGALDDPGASPTGAATTTFRLDASESKLTTTNLVATLAETAPDWSWPRPAAGAAATFSTAPLDADLVVVGPTSADLTVSTAAGEVDLEVTISEVRPDGSELYVQSGWLRTGRRALDPASTELDPVAAPLHDPPLPPTDGPMALRIGVPAFAHVFRAGSSLRLTVDAPGASRPRWTFDAVGGGAEVTIHHDAASPSSLALSTLPASPIAAGPAAACPGLRGQPCRPAS